MSKIDFNQLRAEIRTMQKWHKLYKVLKQELQAKGFWKNRPRGDVHKGYQLGWGKHKNRE